MVIIHIYSTVYILFILYINVCYSDLFYVIYVCIDIYEIIYV